MKEFNYFGTYMLLKREVKRFLKVYHQTLISPVVSALIFLSIFTLAISNKNSEIHNIPYLDFAGYGLIIMTIIQNSFANPSSSLIMAKVIGYINDILMPPLDGEEVITAYALGGAIRGILVGIILTIVLAFIIEFRLHSLPLLIFYILSACILLSLLGIISSFVSDNFEQHSAVSSYLITPLSFLSGTFYSIHSLPLILKKFNLINPFFYLIDGFRYSLIGESDGNIYFGCVYLLFIIFATAFLAIKIFNSGWKLKP